MSVVDIVNKNYDNLSENDLYIVKYILNNKKKCSNIGIVELAKNCNVSKSTILRLTQKLGFSGYSEFKICLKWDENSDNSYDTDYIDKINLSISETIKNNKEQDLLDICKVIYESDRVFIYGTGAAQKIFAQELRKTFMLLQKCIINVDAKYELDTLTKSMTDKDSIIIVSLSGNTKDLDSITNKLNSLGSKIISITKLTSNKLASSTIYNLYACVYDVNLTSDITHTPSLFYYLIGEILIYNYRRYLGLIGEI